MASYAQNNLERLREAGLIHADLPDQHASVVDGLTDDEVEILLSVKRRLDDADKARGAVGEPGELPPFTTFMVF
jgi:hypothetical protein